MISIKDIVADYIASLKKTWNHDRSKTVGASEVGACARKTWFDKNSAPKDSGYTEARGAQVRGDIIEEFVVAALRAKLPSGMELLYAGKEQRSLVKGYLSATTDGIIVTADSEYCLNLDFKSFDPRIDIQKEKPEHAFQVQSQMGLIRECTKHQPSESKVVYVNASFWDDIREPLVKFDPRAYAAAHARARDIMTASNPLELLPEGKMAGGGECKYCAWASHCSEVTVAGVPRDEQTLDAEAEEHLLFLRDDEREHANAVEHAKQEHANSVEAIKGFLREHNTRRYKGEGGWSVSYSVVSGKATLDTQAVEAAGIDLKPYYKTGKSSERLVVR